MLPNYRTTVVIIERINFMNYLDLWYLQNLQAKIK